MNAAAPAALRVVLDTHVLLDLWVFDDPRSRWLHAALAERRLTALRSPETECELAAVLARPRFGLDPPRQQQLLLHWQTLAEPVSVCSTAPLLCTDRDDQKFVDLALGRARLLLTRDRALLRLARRARTHGLAIEPPDGAALCRLGLLVDQDMA